MTKELAMYFIKSLNDVSVEINVAGEDNDTVILVQARLEEAVGHLQKWLSDNVEGETP